MVLDEYKKWIRKAPFVEDYIFYRQKKCEKYVFFKLS